MLATSERDRPHMPRARWVSSRGDSLSSPFSWTTSTSSATVQASWPLGPFTVTVWPSMVTVTPDGTAIGFLPMRDISVDPAQHFAAHVLVAGRGVGHDALGRRKDRDAQAVLHRLEVADRRIDPTARLGDAGDFRDHRLAVEILQLDLELRELARLLDQRVAADVALVLEHVEHALAQARRGRQHRRTLAGRGVLDAGDHVAQGIIDHHLPISLTSSTSSCRAPGPATRGCAARSGSS